jgi:hypothetical protein
MRRLSVLIAAVLGAAAQSPAPGAEAFVGRWAVSPSACWGYGGTATTAPLIASNTAVRWYLGDCRIGKMYKLGHAVYIQARCFGDQSADAAITLDAKGDRMRVTWNRGHPTELQRCK